MERLPGYSLLTIRVFGISEALGGHPEGLKTRATWQY